MTPMTHPAERSGDQTVIGCFEGRCRALFQVANGPALDLTAVHSGVRLRVAMASLSFGTQVGEVVGAGSRLVTIHSRIRLPKEA